MTIVRTPAALATLACLALIVVGSACEERGAKPGIVLVVLDTTRADHLGAYGYGRDTSPNLDRLAREAEVYTRAFAQSPWTLPAMATMLTGRLPDAHGAGVDEQQRLRQLDASVPTLAERLRDAGYRTAAVVNVIFCSPESGLARGFERYDFQGRGPDNRGHRDAAATTDAALAWLEGVREEPFFLLVHYFDPHLTYDPPPPWDTRYEAGGQSRIPVGFGSASQVFALRRGEIVLDETRRESLRARYDGEIAFMDSQFARLRRGLEAMGRWDDSLVIVMGDHGEEFWDHGGFEHGHSHHSELLRVPLIVKRPGRPAGVREGLARQLDVAPTVLDYARVPVAAGLPGRVLDGGGAATSVAQGSLWAGHLLSVRSDAGTLIVEPRAGRGLYFAPDDPRETRNLSGSGIEAERTLRELLRSLPDGGANAEPWQPSPEQIERLRSLGYLE